MSVHLALRFLRSLCTTISLFTLALHFPLDIIIQALARLRFDEAPQQDGAHSWPSGPMYSHDPFVLAVQGLDIPFLEKQRPLNTTSFRGKAQLVAAAKDTNDGQQKHRSATATIEPASSPAMVSVGLPNPSPPCPEEGLQR